MLQIPIVTSFFSEIETLLLLVFHLRFKPFAEPLSSLTSQRLVSLSSVL